MAPIDGGVPIHPGPHHLTSPSKRRGAVMHAHGSCCCDHSHACHSGAILHSKANASAQHVAQAGSRQHSHTHPSVGGGAAQQSPAGGAAAAAQQHSLLRSSSAGPVTTRIHAAAICCPMESRLIHNILDSVPGVLSVDVMVVTKMVSVHHEPTAISPAALVAALNSAGLQASLNRHSTSGGSEPAAAAKSGMCSSGCCGAGPQAHGSWQQQQPQQQRRGLSWLLAALRGNPALPPVCVLLSALLLLVNLLLLLPGVGAPHILQKGLLALIAAAVAVPPVLVKAWNGLRNKNLDMNSLVVVALAGAIGLGDFFEAGALVVLFTLAEWLEERCVQRAAGAMEDILKLQPEEALVIVQDDCMVDQPAQHSSRLEGHLHHQHGHNSCCAAAAPATPTAAEGHKQHSCCAHSHAAADQEAPGPVSTQQAQHSSHHHHHQHEGSCCSTHGCAAAPSGHVPAEVCSAGSHGSSPCLAVGHKHTGADACHSHGCSHGHSHSAPAGHSAPGGADGCAAGAAHQHSCCANDSKASCAAAGCHTHDSSHSHQHGEGGCCHAHQVAATHSHANGSCGHAAQHHHQQCEAAGQPAREQHHGDHHHGSCSSHEQQHSCCHDHAHHSHDHQHHQHHADQEHSFPLRSVPVAQLQVGVLVLVRPGDKVPVDGTIEVGTSVLDESMITGESKPVTKAPGDRVLAGTINCGSVALRVHATAAAVDSTVARLGALMEAAAASKSRHDMAVELFARYYTPAIVLLALLVAGVGSAVQPVEWRHWTYLSLVVLVTGCPCALVISTPVAFIAGLTRAAKKGVLIKGSRALELLGNLTAASFDKSGTLTEGHFQLTKVHTFGPYSRQQALQLAAMLEQHSNHPIAHAIVGAAAAGGCMSGGGAAGALHVTEVAGKGLQGEVAGQAVAVGSWGFAQELLPAAPKAGAPAQEHGQLQRDADAAVMAEAKQLLSSADTAGSTVVCLVVQRQLAALLLLSDRARSDALAAVQQLQQLGVQCMMMTGDTMGAAAHVAGQLGIGLDDVCAELLPQEKLELIGTLRHRLAAGRQRQQAQGAVQRLTGWCRKRLRGRGSTGSSSPYCSSCGELAGDCSCAVALGPDSSSMRRSGSGGFKGSSSAGMRIDAAASSGGSSSGSGGRAPPTGVIIAHVGDGINDAPALAGADVGVAMGVAGAALAVDAADVALFSNDLTSLPFVVRLGRRAGWVVAVNTVFACSIKLAVLGAAAGGVASLWLSLLADVGSSLLVTLHAITLLRFEAGQDHNSSSGAASKLYTSRLSGIPLATGELGAEGATAAVAGQQQPPGTAGGFSQRVRELVARLPGLSWLQPYARLEDCTPAMSAAASRLNSSTARGGFLLGGAQGSGPSLTPKGAAAQELREMAIMACAVHEGAGLLGPQGGGDCGWGTEGSAGRPGGVFVIDEDCC